MSTEVNKPDESSSESSVVVSAGVLFDLARQQALSPLALEESLRMAEVIPDGKSWQNFIHKTLLLLGTALLLCGIIFFFAYNWASLHKFAKLATVQTIILIFVVIAMTKGLDHVVGKCSLLGACVMIGPALGVRRCIVFIYKNLKYGFFSKTYGFLFGISWRGRYNKIKINKIPC